MKNLLAVAIGGACGSLVRYLLSESVTKYPSAVLLSNALGVLVAGVIAYRMKTSEIMRLALIPGLSGGLTTFSSVAVIHAEHNSIKSIGYFFATVITSVLILFVVKPVVQK
ncbi:MAG: fluoride efflux transporter FluC [Actinomycetota bacterium]